VIDEADLILSYGHDEDVRQILSGNYLPKVFQSFLMSATMTKDVEALKGLVLRNPVSFMAPVWITELKPFRRLFFV
jgi:ATP-dependent RNA helicase DDX56/DBP9